MSERSRYWRGLARRDLYWSVLTHDELEGRVPEGAARERFFTSGAEHVDRVLSTVERLYGVPRGGWRGASALDFGCGVGRLLVPLAERCGRVVGVDVSEAMLAEARTVLDERGHGAVELIASPALEALGPNGGGPNGGGLNGGGRHVGGRVAFGTIDLVHSVLVFQHIRPARGMRWLGRLAAFTRPGGVLIVQVCVRRPSGFGWAAVRGVMSAARRAKRWLAPGMEMHEYDLGAVLWALRDEGFHEVHVLDGDQPGHAGVTLCALRAGAPDRA
ncbi:MAG: methyltransferase [Planctomycetota bacterium]